MRMTTEGERKFFEAVQNGATVFVAQDVFDCLQSHGLVDDKVKLCKWLSSGQCVAVDMKKLEQLYTPSLQEWS